MITSIAIDQEYVYFLDAGQIRRKILVSNKIDDPIAGPVHASPVIQVMTSHEWLFALCADGVGFRLYGDDDYAIWEQLDLPAGTIWLASNETSIFTISNDRIYYSSLIGDDSYAITPADPNLFGVSQIDYDEEFGYAVVNGDVYYQQFPNGVWVPYPETLADVVSVVAGTDFVYALDVNGDVYRSQTIGHSVWEQIGSGGYSVLSIPSDHVDRVWLSDGATPGGEVQPYSWRGPGAVVPPVADGWISDDWIDGDWIVVAA